MNRLVLMRTAHPMSDRKETGETDKQRQGGVREIEILCGLGIKYTLPGYSLVISFLLPGPAC